MGKYANNCIKLFLREDEVPRAHRPGTWIFGQEYRFQTDYWKGAPMLVEFLPIMAGAPKGQKGDWPPYEEYVRPNVERDGHKGGPFQQVRHNADLMSFFISSDPDNLDDLGAHIDYHMGTGEDEEIVDVDESVCMYVPAGEVNCPVDISDVRRPFLQINILTQPTKDDCYIEHLYHPFPKQEEEEEAEKEDQAEENKDKED